MRIIISTGELHDACQKANQIAPSKGSAYDKAGGFYLEVDAMTNSGRLLATDTERAFSQRLRVTVEDEIEERLLGLRLYGDLFAELVAKLPMTEESVVILHWFKNTPYEIRLENPISKTFTKMFLMEGPFPVFDDFALDDMTPAAEIQSKLDAVSWATEPGNDVLKGVHLDGKYAVGCDGKVLARVPCPVALDRPVTAILGGAMTGLIARGADVRIRATPTALEVALDEDTRLRTVLSMGAYPNVAQLIRTDFKAFLTFPKQAFLETMARALVLVRRERLPGMTVSLTHNLVGSTLDFDVEVPEVARFRASVNVDTDTEDEATFRMVPTQLLSAVQNASGSVIKLEFGHNDPTKEQWKKALRLSDNSGYEVMILPMRPDKPER